MQPGSAEKFPYPPWASFHPAGLPTQHVADQKQEWWTSCCFDCTALHYIINPACSSFKPMAISHSNLLPGCCALYRAHLLI